MKPWQKGVELDVLKRYRKLVNEYSKGVAFSAFGVPGMNTIAEWLSRKWLRATPGPKAFIVVQYLKCPLKIRDFRGVPVVSLESGACYVRYMAGPVTSVKRLLQYHVAISRQMVFEVWEESESDRRLMRDLGAVWVSTKIKSTSELRGIYMIGEANEGDLFASDDAPNVGVPWQEQISIARLRLHLLPFGLKQAREQLSQLKLAYTDHYSNYNRDHAWSALALRGYSRDPGFIIKPSDMTQKWRDANKEKLTWKLCNTLLRKKLSAFEPIVAAVPGAKHRIRLMRLTPGGGELLRHTDRQDPDLGIEDGQLVRIHVPIVTNPEVCFESWDLRGKKHTVNMKEGEAWYLDIRKPHTAVNAGSTDRIHLVMDVESGEDLRSLLSKDGY